MPGIENCHGAELGTGYLHKEKNLIYFGRFLRQLVMDSKLLLMGEKVCIVIVAECFVREMYLDRAAIPAKSKHFGYFVAQENVWLVLEPPQ